jgi:pyridoxal phosphate enzyme (YggS family)
VTAIDTTSVRENLARVTESIAEAALRSGRSPSDVKLVAVSKTKPPAAVAAAAAAGQLAFGENRVQEAAAKVPEANALAGRELEWHLIGTLQRNKAKVAAGLFAILQSVDSPRLAETLDRLADSRPIPVLLEVYFGEDPTRPGFRPETLLEEYDQLTTLRGLEIRGLMTVAPFGLNEGQTQRVFAELRELRDRLAERPTSPPLPELSMGMTEDYLLAVAEGATIVRLGRAIFGAR